MDNIDLKKKLKVQLLNLQQQEKMYDSENSISKLKQRKTSFTITMFWLLLQVVSIVFILKTENLNLMPDNLLLVFLGVLLLSILGVIMFGIKRINVKRRIEEEEDYKILISTQISELQKQLILLD